MGQPDTPPETKKYRVRVRFNAEQHGEWCDVEAFSAADAAAQHVANGMLRPGITFMGGVLPVEVTEDGSVAVQRFRVDYSVQFKATAL